MALIAVLIVSCSLYKVVAYVEMLLGTAVPPLAALDQYQSMSASLLATALLAFSSIPALSVATSLAVLAYVPTTSSPLVSTVNSPFQ
jgi:hypothetical protein